MLVTGDISSLDGGAFLYGRPHSFYPSTFQGVAATAGHARARAAGRPGQPARARGRHDGLDERLRPARPADLRAAAARRWPSPAWPRRLHGDAVPRRPATARSGRCCSAWPSCPACSPRCSRSSAWPRATCVGRPRAAVVLVVGRSPGWRSSIRTRSPALVLLGYVVLAVVAITALAGGAAPTAGPGALRRRPASAPPVLWAAALQLPRAKAMTRAYAVGPVESHCPGAPRGAAQQPPRRHRTCWVTSARRPARRGRLRRGGPATRWVSAAYVVTALVYVGVVAVQSSATQALTVFWYNDPPRLAALVPVAGVPALTAGLLALSGRSPGPAGPGGGVAATARRPSRWLFAAWPRSATTRRARATAAALLLSRKDPATALLTRQEAGRCSGWRRSIPPDAVVADNPWRGHALLYAFTARRVVFYSEKARHHARPRAMVADALFLAASPLHPDVCAGGARGRRDVRHHRRRERAAQPQRPRTRSSASTWCPAGPVSNGSRPPRRTRCGGSRPVGAVP